MAGLIDKPDLSETKKTASSSVSNSSHKTGGGSAGGSSNLSSSITPKEERQSKGVVVGRVLFMVCLLVLVAILVTSIYLYDKGRQAGDFARADAHYDIISNGAITSIERLMDNRLAGALAMANLAAYAAPRADEWPFVQVDSWWAVGEQVQIAGLNGGYSVAPIVTPEVQPEFEEYAQEFLNKTYPGEEAGVSSFGFGIWCKNKTTDSSDTKYHHTNGYPYSYESENGFATPKYQHTMGNHRLLMMDVHGFPQQGQSIDDAYTCSKNRGLNETNPEENDNCQALSDLTPPKDPLATKGPGAFVSTCVFPAENITECVAFIFAKMNINEVLHDTFPAVVYGIDCVVDTKFSTASYSIEGGKALYRGDQDIHDTAYDYKAISTKLFQGSDLAKGSISYDMTCYPTDEFYQEHETETPLPAIIGSVLIVVCTCVCFFIYDFLVRREFQSKKELLKAKRQFVRFVSHEVRTPLNSVCMALTLLQEEIAQSLGYDTPEEMEKQVENDNNNDNDDNNDKPEIGWFKLAIEVQVNAESSVEVLNDLLNYDKVESGSLTLELTAIPIWDTIEQTVSEFRLPASSKNIKLTLQLPPPPPAATKSSEASCKMLQPVLKDCKVVGDSIRLVQVIRNLVSNALKFTPEGKAVNIKVHWKPSPKEEETENRTFKLKTKEMVTVPLSGEIVICVEDEGAGLSAEQQSRLFGAGVQFNVNELQSGNGSGLGLFIAKGIIEQHEGNLVCHSAGLGCGTSFIVNLPLYNIPDSVPEHSEIDFEFRDTYRQCPLKVLIVDDIRSNRKLLKRLLENRDNVCDEAEDGNEALNMVKETASRGETYDLILLDYEMPVMNGPTAASEIRAIGIESFIVGITGNFMDEDVQFFKKCGANAVLPKPFKVQELENLCVEYHVTGSINDSLKYAESEDHE